MNRNFFLICVGIALVILTITFNLEESVEVKSSIEIDSSSSIDFSNNSSVIYVQVSGAVKNPGLYDFKVGDRYNDLMKEAQPTNANMSCINLAQKLVDEENIVVPASDKPCAKTDTISEGIVNINSASIYDLQSISGIGESKAQAIIDYRDEHGSFTSKDQLLNVDGISESLFSEIEEQISLS